MSVLTRWGHRPTTIERSHPIGSSFSFQSLVDWFTHQGIAYGLRSLAATFHGLTAIRTQGMCLEKMRS